MFVSGHSSEQGIAYYPTIAPGRLYRSWNVSPTSSLMHLRMRKHTTHKFIHSSNRMASNVKKYIPSLNVKKYIPSLKKTTTFQHHYIQAYHHFTQTTKNFTADGDTYYTLLLTDTSSYLSLNADTRSKSLPKNSRITWNSCETPIHRTHFYSTPINWIPWPLRLNLCWPTDVQKKPLVPAVLLTTISPPITSINTSITLMPVLMTYFLMLHITPLPQLSHANALAAKPNMPTFIWIILLLSTYPVALYLPTRYLSFHVDSLSALLHDISTGRKFQPTFTTFLGACD